MRGLFADEYRDQMTVEQAKRELARVGEIFDQQNRTPAARAGQEGGHVKVEKEGVEVDLTAAVWRKSTYSSGNCDNCVEVARFPGARAVRDSKNPDGAVLVFTDAEWLAFTGGVRDGEFS